MAQGTGLPIPKPQGALSQAPTINADAVSSAAAWTKIASAGERMMSAGSSLADTGLDILSKSAHLQQAGAIAEFENDWRTKNIEARDKFAFDPDGFKNWAQSSIDGAVNSVPSWMAPHAKNYMSRTFDGSYSSILSERRSRDEKLAGDSIVARLQAADDDVMALATSGKLNTSEGNASVGVHTSVLDTAVQMGRISPEMADYKREELQGRAFGEIAARQATQIYKEQGFDAAVEYLNKNIRENGDLSLKQAQRDKAFNRGLSQIRLAQAQDKDARTEVVEVSKDLRQRLNSNQMVDPAEVNDTLGALQKTGGAAEYHRLSVDWAVRQATEPYRGNLNLKQFASAVSGARVAAQPGTPEQVGSVTSVAGRLGVKPADLAAAISYETGGTFDPNKWGGKGGNYLGLIQFGPEEQRKYGVRPGMTFEQQMPAVEAFLRDRGVKPGMGISEIYRTINGGNPNANLNASDGNGTIAEHIDRIKRAHYGNADKFLGGTGQVRDDPALAGVPYAGEVAKRVQGVFVQQARTAWPAFKTQIEQGKIGDQDDLSAIRYAAAVSGDANWQREVEAAVVASRVGQGLEPLPAAERQAGLNQIQQELKNSDIPAIDQDSIQKTLQTQFERQNKMARENPVGYWIERGWAAPEPLNLSNAKAAQAGAKDRYDVARMVAQREGIPPSSPFQPAERQAIAAAIRGGNADAAMAGYEAVHTAPDQFLVPTLKTEEIKSAIIGAAHSTDPARYLGAMSALDRLYARAPEDVAAIFGGDVFKQLQDWQAKLRYSSSAELAETLKRRDDPQVRERMKHNIEAGEKIARERKPESLIGEWQGLFGLFGAAAPTDQRTRDAWMQDYINLFGERYAVSLDKDMAHKQAVERMKHYWQKSDVNGGRLTLYPPEQTYQPDFNGSYGWMRDDLEKDITAKIGRKPSDYVVIADPTTEREVQGRQPASYLIAVKNDATGEWDMLRGADQRPQRYKWDATKTRADAREEFARQRERVKARDELMNVQPGMVLGGGF